MTDDEEEETAAVVPLMSSTSMPYDYLLKLLLVGDAGVGKTSMALRFADDTFQSNYISTIGIDFQIRNIRLQRGTLLQLQIWDTAGQERFNAITNAYYKSAHGVMLVYDVTKIMTFEALPRWLKRVKESSPNDVVIMVVGNKSDLDSLRQVSYSRAKKFASDNNLMYVELSAKQNVNLEDAFIQLADICATKLEEEKFRSASTAFRGSSTTGRNVSLAKSKQKIRCCLK